MYWTTLVSRASFLARATSPASLVDTVRSASGAAVLLSPRTLSCAARSPHGRCPVSSVLRAPPSPTEAWRSLGLTALLPLLTMRRDLGGLPQFLHPSVSRHAPRFDPGRFSGAVAKARAYCCLPGRE